MVAFEAQFFPVPGVPAPSGFTLSAPWKEEACEGSQVDFSGVLQPRVSVKE